MNVAMLIDFYELTMANGYFLSGKKDDVVYFDLYFRSIPDEGGYVVFAGLETIIEYISELQFTEEDIDFLRGKKVFDEGFLQYLKDFRFRGDIYSMKEGTLVFPNEPLMTIKANIIEAQLIETYVLQVINHQTLIATKASRIKRSAKDHVVIEMGARRAHGLASSVEGAKAAYIGGIDSTSNVLSDQEYGVPSGGTMAHSWVQAYPSEKEAFETYAKLYPNNSTFLVDTYDTLKSGIPNAIQVIKDNPNITKCAIRIDSGDLAYLSKKARKMLDEAGLNDCKIIVSNSLDEYLIKELLSQEAPIDIFGVGERLITAKSDPVFGAVYKLVAIEEEDTVVPLIKISDNPQKITTPHFKKVYRVKKDDYYVADYISIFDEVIDPNESLRLFDPLHPHKEKFVSDFTLIPLHVPVFSKGKLVYESPSIEETRAYVKDELSKIYPEMKRLSKPHVYYVDLSEDLWQLKRDMIKKQKSNL
jgi:nicotinate phosphoribosyltransferase